MRAADFVHSYIEAWNHQDPVAVAEHLTTDGVYCDVQENTRRSQEELIISLKEFFATHPHRYELIGEILEGQHTIAFQYKQSPVVQGRNTEAFVPILGSEFVTWDGDSAMEIQDYYQIPEDAPPEQRGKTHRNRPTVSKYAKSGLGGEQLAQYKQRLERVMDSEKIFLESDLTLPKLAKQINCSVNHLSQAINAGFGVSFFDYLNQFRIEYARELLANTDNEERSILDIAFAVGYNSNSAFYSAFKKFVGVTPAEYRRRYGSS